MSEKLDGTRLAAYKRALERRVRRARSDPSDFFSFAMMDPEEPTRRIFCQPHQEVAFAFMGAHRNGVIQWATDTGKTISTVGQTLYTLGLNSSANVLLVGKSENIAAERPFALCRDYLEKSDLNARVRQVFPHLVPSEDAGQSWTQTDLIVQRPAGAAGVSIKAAGFESDLQGSKFDLILCDDLLDDENCATEHQRKKLLKRFFSLIYSRRKPKASTKVFVINVPFDQNDLTFTLMKSKDDGGRGWPGLRMDVWGNVEIVGTDWRSELLRPSRRRKGWWRLKSHDPDEQERVPLFPVRWPRESILQAKEDETPTEFSRSREINPLAPEDQRCQRAWIEGGTDAKGRLCKGCLRKGTAPILEADETFGSAKVFIGEDVSTGEADDESAIVPIAVLPDGRIALLNVEAGKWTGPEQGERSVDAISRYDADIVVESNGYQKTLRQWIVDERGLGRDDLDHRVLALNTDDKKKESKLFGLEAIFWEFYRGEWVFPADRKGRLVPEIEALVQECLDYRPGEHVGDRLMALHIARARAHPYVMALRRGRKKATRAGRPPDERLAAMSRLNVEQWRGKGSNGKGLAAAKTGGF